MYGKPLLCFDNRFADAAPVADTTAPGDFVVANLADFRPYTFWKPAALPCTVQVDSGVVVAADYLLVYGHNLGTQGAGIRVSKSNDGAANDTTVATISPVDDAPFILQFASTSERWWRINVFNQALPGADGPLPTLAIAAVGSVLEFPRRLQTGFDPLASSPRGRNSVSEKGQPLGTAIGWREWKQKVAFHNITAAWLRSTWEPAFDNHLSFMPSVFVWDPVEHAGELKLLHPITEYQAPHLLGQFCDLGFTLEGLSS